MPKKSSKKIEINLSNKNIFYKKTSKIILEEDDEHLSECCGAPIIYHDLCSECKEHCL